MKTCTYKNIGFDKSTLLCLAALSAIVFQGCGNRPRTQPPAVQQPAAPANQTVVSPVVVPGTPAQQSPANPSVGSSASNSAPSAGAPSVSAAPSATVASTPQSSPSDISTSHGATDNHDRDVHGSAANMPDPSALSLTQKRSEISRTHQSLASQFGSYDQLLHSTDPTSRWSDICQAHQDLQTLVDREIDIEGSVSDTDLRAMSSAESAQWVEVMQQISSDADRLSGLELIRSQIAGLTCPGDA